MTLPAVLWKVLALLAGVLLFLLLLPADPAQADHFAEIYAQDYTASWDAPDGVLMISAVSCLGALQGVAVRGMDAYGDWVEIPMRLGEQATFVDSLRSAGAMDYVRDYAVLFLDSFYGDVLASDTLTTIPGLGIH